MKMTSNISILTLALVCAIAPFAGSHAQTVSDREISAYRMGYEEGWKACRSHPGCAGIAGDTRGIVRIPREIGGGPGETRGKTVPVLDTTITDRLEEIARSPGIAGGPGETEGSRSIQIQSDKK